MTEKATIPAQNQPYRRQSSLGGNVSWRNLNSIEDSPFVVLGQVVRVYYKKGLITYRLTDSAVTSVVGNRGQAPIPVDFFGRRSNGQVFGHYRPIQSGDLVAVAYLNGHLNNPIILGVYPNSPGDYEFVTPPYVTDSGDDSKDDVANYALADRKIYPDGTLAYRSGNGEYYKSLAGNSFLILDDSPLYEHLWTAYDKIGAFEDSSADTIEPLKEKAGDWLLIHEDNPKAKGADNHRTRFYVNHDGSFQVVLLNRDDLSKATLLEGNKDKGITISKLWDMQLTGFLGDKDKNKDPELDKAPSYVKLNIGNNDTATIEAASKKDSVQQSSQLTIKSDGIYINGKLLVKGNNAEGHRTIIDDAVANSDDLNNAIEQAHEASENAKRAGDEAVANANNVQANISDMKENMKYYLSLSRDNDYGMNDGGTSAWEKVFNQVYIKDTNSLRITASNLEAGIIEANDITVKNLKLSLAQGNEIDANTIKAGTIIASKIDSPELSDISNRLGHIEAGSIAIGKVDDSGKSIDKDTIRTVDETINYGAIAAPLAVKHFTNVPAELWTSLAGYTIIVKMDVSLQNYYKAHFDNIPDDALLAGFRVTLTTASGSVDYDAPLDTSAFYDAENIKTTISTQFRVPSDVIDGDIKVFGNIKVGSLSYGPITISYDNPEYTAATKDAFLVDSQGNVTARSLKAIGGEITGGTISGTDLYGTSIIGTTVLSWTKYDSDDNLVQTTKKLSEIDDRTDNWFMLSGNNLLWHTAADADSKDNNVKSYGATSFIGTDLSVFHQEEDSSGDPWHKLNGIGIQSYQPIYFGRGFGTIGSHDDTPYPDGNYSGPSKILEGTKKRIKNSTTGADFDGLQSHLYDGAVLGIGTDDIHHGSYDDIHSDNPRASILAYLGASANRNAGVFSIQKDNRIDVCFGASDKSNHKSNLGNNIYFTTSGPNNVVGANGKFEINSEVVINGSLSIKGDKSNIVNTSQGTLALNAYETPETYYGDIGSATTDGNGEVIVSIDRIFNETVNTTQREYQVFITPYSDAKFWVDKREPHFFVVKSDKPNASFGWEIKALRLGYENQRLENKSYLVDNITEV